MASTICFILLAASLLVRQADGACSNCGENNYQHFKHQNETLRQFVQRMLANYDGMTRPHLTRNKDAPTVIRVHLTIISISSFNIMDMDYSMEIYLRQEWMDRRLQFKGIEEEVNLESYKSKLWLPDIYIANAKSTTTHAVTVPNVRIRLYGSGKIAFTSKLTVRLACNMELSWFPMDTQNCEMEMGSFGYSDKHITFQWLDPLSRKYSSYSPNVFINSKLTLNEFHRPIIQTSQSILISKFGKSRLIRLVFLFRRKFGYYIIYTYIPTLLIVSLSWLSFFIDCSAVPARISLGLLAVLNLMTHTTAILQKLPRVSYIKAIDLWLFTCLAFVFLSNLEYFIVYVMYRRQEKLAKKEKDNETAETKRRTPGAEESANNTYSKRLLRRLKSAKGPHKIDRFFIFAYPIGFVVFNIVYWSVCLSAPCLKTDFCED